MEQRIFSIDLAGRPLTVEAGKVAGQADGAVTLRYGDTVVLVTACVADKEREDIDFVPLTVDYEERLYAAGKIPGGFIRREGRPSQEAILASRLTDRPIRPLLHKGWRREVQLVITVLSADQENAPDILALNGASFALHLSEVPFDGPVAAVRIGYINGEFVVNPTLPQLDASQLELVVASTRQAIVMVEAGAKEAPEEIIVRAMQLAHEANQAILDLQEEVRQACGRPKVEHVAQAARPEIVAEVAAIVGDRLAAALVQVKGERQEAVVPLRDEVKEKLAERYPERDINVAFDYRIREEIRKRVLASGKHFDGREASEIRPVSCEVGLLPRTHGSALFTRGLTQVLTITTLGPAGMEQRLDGLGIEESKRFIHHYNFPPFSSGEVKRMGTPSRREIGHGALAERALLPIIPRDEDFPYTIRLVSEVLSSSGSTSQASICASSLSLMDAGVPVRKAVAGVAMGLFTGSDGSYTVLTDIEGIEDAYGDMDFKVAGTREGVTAMQLDTKLKGISLEILASALGQARDARLRILDIMNRTMSAPRPELSQYAPRIYKITIPVDKIGTVIGPGGKTIRSIIEESKATIDIEDDGTVLIGAMSEESGAKAIKIIEGLTKEPEVGTVYTGKVSRILNFGAMVEILPGKEGLVHISELADHRVDKVEDEVKIGDQLEVKLIGIDALGRLNLSRRAILEPSRPIPAPRERSGAGEWRPERGGDRGGRPPMRRRPPER